MRCLSTLVIIWSSLSYGQPTRILSTSLASDEILLELLPESEWTRVAAISPMARNPQYSHLDSQKISRLPAYRDALESLIVAKPDLVIMASFNKPAILAHVEKSQLRHLKLSQFKNVDDIKRNITSIASAIGHEQRGFALAAEFTRKVHPSSNLEPEKRPRILSLERGFLTMGRETLFNDLVRRAGGQNLAVDWGVKLWAKVSEEKILATRPDIIILAQSSSEPRKEFSWFYESSLGRGLDLQKRLCLIPARSLLSTSHHVSRALSAMKGCVRQWQH